VKYDKSHLSPRFFVSLSLSFFVEVTPEKELVVCFGYRLFLDIILSLSIFKQQQKSNKRDVFFFFFFIRFDVIAPNY
jgi:hypothetical protein